MPHPALPSFESFRERKLAEGHDEVLERVWAPGTVVADHTHPFDADALVVAGEVWLTEAGATRRLVAGDTFVLARGTPHAERYGAEGATYWVARRG